MEYLNNDNLPLGAYDDSKAPYNEEILGPKVIPVTISMSISKTLFIEVDDYKVDINEDDEGKQHIHYDYSECDLEKAVKNNCVLPTEVYSYIQDSSIRESLKNWNIDDFIVIKEE